MTLAPSLDLSVIIPLKDEAQSIRVLAREVEQALAPLALEWECLWIDDGSGDDSAQILEVLHRTDGRHQVLVLDRNYGQSAALSIGFKEASGKVFATLDGDLQNDPADLPWLLEVLSRGEADMVNGIREKRQDSWIRKVSSKVGNGFRNWVTGKSVTDVGCSLRVFRRECVEDIPLWKGMHRFLPTLVRMRGFCLAEVPVNHRPRQHGEAKYAIGNRLWVGLADTLAVRWMQWRKVVPRLARSSKKRG